MFSEWRRVAHSKQLSSIALLFCLLVSTFALAEPPRNSWEAWITAIRNAGRGGLPGRPDYKTLDATLPLWVDCELQWHFDRDQGEVANPLKKRVVLRAAAKDCRQSLLYWAQTISK
jgi:hypothetical protein